jgi:hypothetical protein
MGGILKFIQNDSCLWSQRIAWGIEWRNIGNSESKKLGTLFAQGKGLAYLK